MPDHADDCACSATDTHAHLWPQDYLDYLQEHGAGGVGAALGMDASDSDTDLAARFAMMDRAGVARQVLSATPQLLQTDDAEACATAARMINDRYAELVAAHPDRFLAYGAAPLPHVDAAVAETRRVVTELGFPGIALNTLMADGGSIANEAFEPFYAELNRLEAVLYIHPTGMGACSPAMLDHKLEWVVGAPIEDTLAVLHLLQADIPHRFPQIRIHVAHLGGIAPFLARRIEDNFEDWDAFLRSPIAEMRRFWYDTANFHAPALRCIAESFGSDRLMLGSDFPYFKDKKYTRAVTYIRESGLPVEVQEAILSTNVDALLRLKAAAPSSR